MKILKKAFLFLGCCTIALTANNLPIESSLVTGELENGMKYTIKKNMKPEERAILRLLVKSGSLDEDDDQKGIAHLVEHMAFNGTKNFKSNDLIKFLESIGVAFGSHLNASTSTTRTLYKLNVPLKNDNLEKAMLIFSDWAGRINFTKKELDKERGVVLEEARARHDMRFRLYLKSKDVIYANSKYKDRTPIGDLDIIRNIKLDRVKAFYDDWYRPEFMHFVIVGDFDVKEVEKLIIQTFSSFTNNSTRKQTSREVPKVEKTRVLVLKDKELTTSSVKLDFVENYNPILTKKDYKDALVRAVAIKLFNLKANEQFLKRNPAAKSIKMISRRFATNLRKNSFYASYTGVKEIDAFKEMTSLIYTIDKYGFNKSDFKRTIKELKVKNKEFLKSLVSKSSKKYADQITSFALNNKIFIDEKYQIKISNEILTSLEMDEVNKAYKQILTSKSRLITYIIANKSEISKRRVKQILLSAKDNVKKQKKEMTLPDEILTKKLKPIKIVKEVYNKKYDFYQFTLENGVKVAYKFNDYIKNSVLVNSFSKGGFSIYETKDLTNAKYSTSIIPKSGLGKYNILEVKKIYADKMVKIKPRITRYNESISGSSITRDFKYLLEAFYLFTTDYRFDENVLENTKHMVLSKLKRANKVPKKKFSKEFIEFLYANNKRFSSSTKEDIEGLNKEDLLRIYKDRFSDLNNFMFVIVGDISKDEVKENIKKYLGNIPTSKRDETYNFRGIKPLKGEQSFIKNFNNENISSISLSYSKELPYSFKEAIKLSAFKDVLSTKLREFIREEKSGVYGVSVKTSFQREPYSKSSIRIAFTCDPKRKDELVQYVKEVLEDLKINVVEQKYVDSFIKKRLLGIKESRKTAKFWLGQLKNHYYYNDDLKRVDMYEKYYKSITPLGIKNTANKYLNTKNIIYTELNPKSIIK